MMKKHIPNLLTLLRVAAVPVALVVATAFPTHTALMFWLFVGAAVTDFLDGYLARKWQVVSPLGTLLDPVADKLLVAVVLIYLLKYTNAPLGAIGLIIIREIYVAGLREFLALRGKTLPVSKGGKYKTALQLVSIALLLASVRYALPYVSVNGQYLISAWNIGVILLWVSALLALTSAIGYTRRALPALR